MLGMWSGRANDVLQRSEGRPRAEASLSGSCGRSGSTFLTAHGTDARQGAARFGDLGSVIAPGLAEPVADRARRQSEATTERGGQVAVVREAQVGGDRGDRRVASLDAAQRRGHAQ